MADNVVKDGAGADNSMNRWSFHDEAGSISARVVMGSAWAAVFATPVTMQGCNELDLADSAQAKREIKEQCTADAAQSGDEHYYEKTYTAENGKSFVCEAMDKNGRMELTLTQVLER